MAWGNNWLKMIKLTTKYFGVLGFEKIVVPYAYKSTRYPMPRKVETNPHAKNAERTPMPKNAERYPMPRYAERTPMPKNAERYPMPRKAERYPMPRKAERYPMPFESLKLPTLGVFKSWYGTSYTQNDERDEMRSMVQVTDWYDTPRESYDRFSTFARLESRERVVCPYVCISVCP